MSRCLAPRPGLSSPVPTTRWPGSSWPGRFALDRLFVGGEEVVRDGHLVRADEAEIAKEQRRQAAKFAA